MCHRASSHQAGVGLLVDLVQEVAEIGGPLLGGQVADDLASSVLVKRYSTELRCLNIRGQVTPTPAVGYTKVISTPPAA